VSEKYAQVFRKNAASPMGPDYVAAIVACLASPGQTRWTVPLSTAGKALLQCAATGAQIVLHSSVGTGNQGQVQIGYAPTGGVTDYAATTPVLDAGKAFTGLRNITGTTALITLASARLVVAAYEDALLIAIESTLDAWRVAALAGGVLTPLDDSDIARNIGTDALFVGFPTSLPALSAGNWLLGSSLAGQGSCALVGASFEPLWAIGNRYVAGAAQLNRAGTVERLVPYLVHTLSGTTGGACLGATKYLRQWRANVPHNTRLFSDTAGSLQAWNGYAYPINLTTTATQNQFALWGQTETTVTP
jgi:hypothetical protein